MLQLQSMVGVPERVDRYEPSYQQPIQPMMQNQIRPQEAYSYQSATPVTPVSAAYSLPVQRRYDYAYPNATTSAVIANTPPSPSADELNKPSLPSISSLLEITNGKQAEQQASAQTPQQVQQQLASQQAAAVAQANSEYADSLAQNFVTGRLSLPSTPPLVADAPLEGNQSPSTVSTQSTVTGPQTYYIAQPPLDQQRGPYSEPHVPKRLSITSQPSVVPPYPTPQYTPTSQYTPTTQYAASQFVSSPTAMSGPYYGADSHVLPSSSSNPAGLYSQRPLPSNFPPPITALPFNPSAAVGGGGGGGHTSPWQHHHYISASSQSTFPPSQDRYVCPTCNKAFSRPSSLRIHSHSHTGEKPFKCSHVGCGKAFSVRSNMKRHERGCHQGLRDGSS